MDLTDSLPHWRVMNLFAKACGATGPIQLSVERSDEPAIERHIFDAPFLTVGRDPRADICLTHRGISRRHDYLQLVSGRLFCLVFFSSRRRHTRSLRDWSSDVCSSDLGLVAGVIGVLAPRAPESASPRRS